MIRPAAWRQVRIGEVATFAYGKALVAGQRSAKGTIPVYGSSGVVGFHNKATHNSASIIVGRKGNVGSVYYEPGPSWCIDTAFYLSDYDASTLTIEYFSPLLKSLNINQYAAYSGVPGISLRDLETISIFLPPLKEQERIVETLGLAETIREQRRQATEKAKGLILRLFEEMFLQNPERDKWPVVTVGEAGSVQLGRQRSPQYQTGRYTKPDLRVANVLEDKIDVSDVLEMDFDIDDFRKYRLSYGDILLNEGQSTELVGRPAMWRNELPECCFQNHLIRFRADQTRSYTDFAMCLFLRYFKDGTFSRLSTNTSNIATLGLKRFVALDYPLPPLRLQEEFVQKSTAIRGVIKDIQAKEARMNKVLESLIAQAFNGTLTSKWREAHTDAFGQSVIQNGFVVVSDTETPDVNQNPDLAVGPANRVAFWKDVPAESLLNAVYNAVSSNAYFNAQTIADKLNQSSQIKFMEYEVTIALEILSTAGLILPVTLEMPDPANPSETVVCINAYRLLRTGDDGRSDYIGQAYETNGSEAAIGINIDHLGDHTNNDSKSKSTYNDESVPSLLADLRYSSSRPVRRSAVNALLNIGMTSKFKGTIQHGLIRALGDDDDDVKRLATEALRILRGASAGFTEGQ